jgi:D-alanyl-lipoteichoic acid acyltransferase DltB (MBOAT superfamily)
MSRLGAIIIAGAMFALGTIFAVRAENLHFFVWTTPLLAMLALRLLRLQWADLAKAVLISTLIMAIEWRQAAVIMGLIQMLGVSLLVFFAPKERRKQPLAEVVKESMVIENAAKTEKSETSIAIPAGKIFLTALSIPALIVLLGGGLNEDTLQMAILVSMGMSLFLGLVALVLSLLKEVRTSAIAGATGALLFYISYLYIFLSESN